MFVPFYADHTSLLNLGFFNSPKLALQPLYVGLYAGTYSDGGGGAQAVLLRNQHGCELVSASDQGVEQLGLSVSQRAHGGAGPLLRSVPTPRPSRASVFASLPVALAKSRTCLGLTTTTGIASTARAATRGSSKPPDASNRTMAGPRVFRQDTSCRTPASSLGILHLSSVGQTATSNPVLAT